MRLFLTALMALFCCQTAIRGGVMISEFMADNANGLKDENGDRQDWIELYNTDSSPVNLDGWWLTDKSSTPAMWRFPAVSIGAKSSLLIWASGKDRTQPAAPLHTNFSLSKSGEYLGLYKPNSQSGLPELVVSFGSAFPAQATDVSYGFAFSQTTNTLVNTGFGGRYKVLGNNSTGQANYSGSNYAAGDVGTGLSGGWNVSPSFDHNAWTSCTTGLGYDTDGGLNAWISSNCQSAFQNVNTSLLLRQVFNVANPSTYTSYKLRMKYEDGFVAWLNGTEIGRANFSGNTAYNSKATASLDETIVNAWTEFTIPAALVLTGSNVLAIQGLNSSLSSSDFLLLPEISAGTDPQPEALAYFASPTPNSINGAGTAGPVLYGATPEDPDVPRPLGNSSSPAMAVTVRVIRTANPVSTVRAYFRTMWNAESSVPMNDAGTGADAVANDGTYSGLVPTSAATAGQMFRWRFEARDSATNTTKLPSYADPLNSPQYFGTVALNASASNSQLPMLDWFVENAPASGPSAASFRGCCYYLNRFYDNIGHEIHGQSTSGFSKKSYDFDSNSDNRFVWKVGEGSVKDLNLMTNYADKTKARNTLAHEFGKLAGTPYHFCFPVRVHLNAAFHGVMDLMEDGDDRMLERNGLDGDGAFYKMYDGLASTGNGEKKTRLTEDKSDLQALINGLNTSTHISTRRAYAYDNVNIPACVNYLVTRTLTSDRDHGHKNFYIYRDTNRTREWRLIVWDVDLSFGHDWSNSSGYFDDVIYYINPIRPGHTTNNRLYQIIAETPEFRAMYLRRLRTVMDTVFQPPGTTNGLLETRMRQIAASVDPDPVDPSAWTDGDLDAARWGVWGRGFRPREEAEYVIANHFLQRRAFLYDQNSATRQLFGVDAGTGDPIPNNAQISSPAMVTVDSVDYLPSSGNQNQEYVILRNNTAQAVDLSGWKLDGAIDHTFEGGTVIPPGAGTAGVEYQGLLHVARDAVSFRSRSSGPTGGQKRLVQGNYQGQLSARGETVNLRDGAGQLIHSFSYPGTPTNLQRYLRVSEIQYHPADPSLAESNALIGVTDGDFEYIELANTGPSTLNLTGASFVSGVQFTFPSFTLASGARVLVAKNPAAFALRYPSTGATVFGPWMGDLDNAGERIELVDAVGESVLDFTYKDGWYPATDGSGRSLVVRDPVATPHDSYGDPLNWAISSGASGGPGVADVSFAQAYHGWDNFHFTSAERDDPLVSGSNADPDGDGRSNLEEYALATDPRVSDPPGVEFVWSMDGSVRKPALRFRRPSNAIDLNFELLASDDGAAWSDVAASPVSLTPSTNESEEVVFRDVLNDAASRRFLRMRFHWQP